MKKLLVLLLISALAIFVFAGCDGLVPGEGEGEGEGEIEEVTVDIDGAVVLGNKTYVSAGEHDITVTFPAPLEGSVTAWLSLCSGNYAEKGLIEDLLSGLGLSIVLFPNEDRTIWEGSVHFGATTIVANPTSPTSRQELIPDFYNDCCASYLSITAGECEDDVCVKIPVVVDHAKPYTELKVSASGTDCTCGGCALTVTSVTETDICDPDVECCGDLCSGLAGWSIRIFDKNPWNVCCDTECETPIFTDSGTGCPVEFTTDCLDEGITYYALLELEDNVLNKTSAAYAFSFDTGCNVSTEELGAPGTCVYDNIEFCETISGAHIIKIDPDDTAPSACVCEN